MCPLLIAIDQGNPPVVRMSLCAQSPQADLNVANWEGKTALILAIEKGDVEILDALLDVNLESLNIYHKDVSPCIQWSNLYVIAACSTGNGSHGSSCGCGE